ncbi:MAG: IPT/TIG domain-containing protein [Thermoanaerobaculia bacterium]
MAEGDAKQDAKTSSVSDIDDIPPESSGGEPVGTAGIFLITAYLVLFSFLVVYGLIAFWPTQSGKNTCSKPKTESSSAMTAPSPTPTPTPTTTPNKVEQPSPSPICYRISYFNWEHNLPSEQILLIIVLLSGALGGLVHALRSLYWYVGNRRLVWSWALMYLLLPFLGITMALVFYLIIRGGFFSPTATIDDTSPFGFAAWAVLVGMFTREAADKLKQVFETLLTKAEKGKDHVGAPVISKINPSTGLVSGGETVKITGSGFLPASSVHFGSSPAQTTQVSNDGTTLTVVTPKANAPGQVVLEVANGDQKATDTFTYT